MRRTEPGPVATSTFPVFDGPVPSQVLATWDRVFCALWDPDVHTATHCAASHNAPEGTGVGPDMRQSEAVQSFLQS